MTKARAGLEHPASALGHPDHVTQHHRRASKLFEKDHAYAARLVQVATAIRSEMRSSTATIKLPDRASSEIEGDDRIMTGIVGQSRAQGSGA